MSYEKLQGYQALAVYKSDDANIPYPSEAADGRTTSTVANKLKDTAATFVTNQVAIGDIVYNTSDGTAATVTLVEDEETLVLNADIMTAPQTYIVYNASKSKNYQDANNGCVLYLGDTDGDLRVTTITGNIVDFKGLKAGTFFPVQVKKVHESQTTLTNIVALW
jgi:hypothetical protein